MISKNECGTEMVTGFKNVIPSGLHEITGPTTSWSSCNAWGSSILGSTVTEMILVVCKALLGILSVIPKSGRAISPPSLPTDFVCDDTGDIFPIDRMVESVGGADALSLSSCLGVLLEFTADVFGDDPDDFSICSNDDTCGILLFDGMMESAVGGGVTFFSPSFLGVLESIARDVGNNLDDFSLCSNASKMFGFTASYSIQYKQIISYCQKIITG